VAVAGGMQRIWLARLGSRDGHRAHAVAGAAEDETACWTCATS
jgi:hypothetical protein